MQSTCGPLSVPLRALRLSNAALRPLSLHLHGMSPARRHDPRPRPPHSHRLLAPHPGLVLCHGQGPAVHRCALPQRRPRKGLRQDQATERLGQGQSLGALGGGGCFCKRSRILRTPTSNCHRKKQSSYKRSHGKMRREIQNPKKRPKGPTLQANLAVNILCFGTFLHSVTWPLSDVGGPWRFKDSSFHASPISTDGGPCRCFQEWKCHSLYGLCCKPGLQRFAQGRFKRLITKAGTYSSEPELFFLLVTSKHILLLIVEHQAITFCETHNPSKPNGCV